MEQKTSPVFLFNLLMEQMCHFLHFIINLPCILMIIVFWHGPSETSMMTFLLPRPTETFLIMSIKAPSWCQSFL